MFEKIGQKLMRGAKAEIAKVTEADPKQVVKVASTVMEIGLFLLVIFCGKAGGSSVSTPTVIVNNYLGKGDGP